MNTPSRLTQTLIATTIVTAGIVGTVAVVNRTESKPPERMATVYVWPVMYEPSKFRMNVALVTQEMDSRAWSSIRPALTMRGNEFRVRVWRIRSGAMTPKGEPLPDVMLVDELYIRAASRQPKSPYSVPAEGFERPGWGTIGFARGDVIAVEWVPALLARDGWPIASVIDNRSNDPVTMAGTRMPLTLTGNCYETRKDCGG